MIKYIKYLYEMYKIIKDVYDAENSGIDVFIQDSEAPYFQYFIVREDQTDITLTADVEANKDELNVSAGHGFNINDYLVIWENDTFEQLRVTGVTTNKITLEAPIARPYTIAGSTIDRCTKNLNLSGSLETPVEVTFNPKKAVIPIDITKIVITTFGSTAADLGTFGNIGELTNGMYFQKYNTDYFNLGNYRVNQDFVDRGAGFDPNPKAPAGSANAATLTFNLLDVFGHPIRLKPYLNEKLSGFIRDPLTALDSLYVSLIGSYTIGEVPE